MKAFILTVWLLLLTVAHAGAQCVGDCNGDGMVDISELITLVNSALVGTDPSVCPNGIPVDTPHVTIAVIVRAVNSALDGCGPLSTDTPTGTPTQAPTDTFTSTRTRTVTSTATFTATGTQTTTSMATPTVTFTPTPRFVDNGDGTVSDTQTGLMWEKKDQASGLHDENVAFFWAGDCSGNGGFCQPDAAAAAACTAATNFAAGCAQCPGSQTCDRDGFRTIWQWLNDLNAGIFAGHNDWRIPTVAEVGGEPELETILYPPYHFLCNVPFNTPCTWPIFNNACTPGCTVTECSCTRAYPYWSATTFVSGNYLPGAWYVNFSDSDVEFAEAGLLGGDFVRAVRGGLPPTQTPTAMGTQTTTSMATPTVTFTPLPRFVDNGDGTVSDTQTGLMWEKKDQAGSLHDANSYYPWSGYCSDDSGDCQPDAAAATTCAAATASAEGCAQCTGSATCDTAYVTIWQWLNQINASHFAGHSDWRIPTVLQDSGRAELETIIDGSAPGCRDGTAPCVPSAFDTACAAGCTLIGCSCTRAYYYWSASTYAVSPDTAWYISFFGGYPNTTFKAENANVRAVRGGP